MLDTPRFKSFSCVYSKEFLELVYLNSTCNMTKLDRHTTALNFYIHLYNPTDHVFVSHNFTSKIPYHPLLLWLSDTICIALSISDRNFREVIKIPELNLCLFASLHFDGFMLEQMIELFKKVIPKGSTKCPLNKLVFWNITIPSHKLFSFLPSGVFKVIIPVRYDDKGPNLYNVTTSFQFESIKNKLGNWGN